MKTLTMLLALFLFASCSDGPANHPNDAGMDAKISASDSSAPETGPASSDATVDSSDGSADGDGLPDATPPPVPTRIHLKNELQGDIGMVTTFTFRDVDGAQVDLELQFSALSPEQYVVDANAFEISTVVDGYPEAGGVHAVRLEPDTLNTLVFVGTNLDVPEPATPPNDVTPRFVVIPGERTVDFPFTKDIALLHNSPDAPPIKSFWLGGEKIPEFAGLHFGEAGPLVSTSGQGQLARLEFEGGITRELYIPSEWANTGSVLETGGLVGETTPLFFLWLSVGQWEIGTQNQYGISPPAPIQMINLSGSTVTVEYTPEWILADAVAPRAATETRPAPRGEFGVLIKEGAGSGSFAQIELVSHHSRNGVVLYEVNNNRRIAVGVTDSGTLAADERQIVVFNATTAPIEVSVDGETQSIDAESFGASGFEFSNPAPAIVLPTGSGEVVDLSAAAPRETLTLVIDGEPSFRGLLVYPDGSVAELLP